MDERLPKPCVCIQHNTRRGGSGGCRVEVNAVVKSEVSPVFLFL